MPARTECAGEGSQRHRFIGLGPLHGTVVKEIIHRGSDVRPGTVLIYKGECLETVAFHLRGQCGRKSRRPCAQGKRHLAFARLSTAVGDSRCDHKIVIAGIAMAAGHGHTGLRRERNTHREVAVVVGHHAVFQHRFAIVVTITAPPPCRAAHHPIAHIGTLHRYTGIAPGRSFHHQRVTGLIAVVDFREVDLESGALVLFHIEEGTAPITTTADGEPPCKSRGRKREVSRSHAKFIGGDGLLLHLLVVGIAQGEHHGLSASHVGLLAIHQLMGEHGHMHGLPRTIESPVGEKLGAVFIFLRLPIVISSPNISIRTIAVVGRGGIDGDRADIGIAVDSLALIVAGERDFGSHPTGILTITQMQGGPGQRLSRGGIHGDIAYLIVGQRLLHCGHIGHIEQQTVFGHVTAGCGGIGQIDTGLQSVDDERVGRQLIVRDAHIAESLRDLSERLHQLAQRSQIFGPPGVETGRGIDGEPRHGECDATHGPHAPQVEHDTMVGYRHLIVHSERERGPGELFQFISQPVDPRPPAPLAHGIVDVAHAFFHRGILCLFHESVTLDGQFTCFGQILIHVDERVDGVQVFRLAHEFHLILALFAHQPIGADAGRSPVAMRLIVVVECLIVASSETDNMQQVIAKDTAVGPSVEKRFESGGLVLCQQVGILHRKAVVFLRCGGEGLRFCTRL